MLIIVRTRKPLRIAIVDILGSSPVEELPMGEAGREMERHEIVVIGGGAMGLAAARALRIRGHDVCLIERGAVGGEASGAAAGILGAVSETDRDDLARLGARSVSQYRALIPELCDATGVCIDFWKEGTIRLAYSPEENGSLRERLERAGRVGVAANFLEPAEVHRLEPDLAIAPDQLAVLFPDEGRVEGASLCAALGRDFVARGGALRCSEKVRRVTVEGGKVSGVEADGVRISCDAVVDCAGAWSGGFEGAPEVPVEPVRGQIVCLHAARPLFRHTIYTDAIYAAARRDGRLLVGSTRERVGYEKQVTAEGVASILGRAFRLSSSLRSLAVAGWWSGLRPVSADGMPIVGFWPGLVGYFVATGLGRNGILLAPVISGVVADCFEGRATAESGLLDPARLVP